MTSFNLVDEPWLPCVESNGRPVHVGIRQALLEAHHTLELRDESPLTTVALTRLLLAVLHAALDGPKDQKHWKAIWKAGHFDAKVIGQYLDEWSPRFDLFDSKHPFFQVAGFEIPDKSGKPKDATPVTKLIHERATGNSPTLFDHTVEEVETAVTPAVAARWLVTCQSYALGGGVGATSNRFGKHPNFTHAPMVGGVAVLLEGSSLFETLALNLVVNPDGGPIPSKGNDKPIWEQDKIDEPGERRPRGLREFLTWRSRMVRLLPEENDGVLTVSGMHFASGWELVDGVINPAWGYVRDEKTGEHPVGLRTERSLWRDSSALLTVSASEDERRNRRPAALDLAHELVHIEVLAPTAALRILTLGFENDKAKVLMWRRETWSVPAQVVHDPATGERLVHALDLAENGGKALYAALSRLMEHFKDSLAEIRTRGMAAYWAALDTPFRRLVADIAAAGDAAIAAWRTSIIYAARAALDQVGDNVQRRSAREMQARVAAQSVLEWKLAQVKETGKETDNGFAGAD